MPAATMTSALTDLDALAWALNLALAQTARERKRHPTLVRNRFYPSDLFSCRRKVGLGFIETPVDLPPAHTEEARYWGNVIHSQYAKRLAAAPGLRVVAGEQKVDATLPGLSIPLRGRFDFLIETAPAALVGALFPDADPPPVLHPLPEFTEPIRLLLDIKSTSGLGVAGVLAAGPRLADRAEITLYEHLTGVHTGLLIYHDRDRAGREIIPVPYDAAFFSECLDWLRAIDADLAAGLIPDAEFDPTTDRFPCGSCAFRTYCAAIPNRMRLLRPTPDPDVAGLARQTLTEALAWLYPLRQQLAPTLQQLGRVTVDGVRAERPWRLEPTWNAQRLADVFTAFGVTDVEPTPEHAQQLAREGRIPARALTGAQDPPRADQLVLRL